MQLKTVWETIQCFLISRGYKRFGSTFLCILYDENILRGKEILRIILYWYHTLRYRKIAHCYMKDYKGGFLFPPPKKWKVLLAREKWPNDSKTAWIEDRCTQIFGAQENGHTVWMNVSPGNRTWREPSFIVYTAEGSGAVPYTYWCWKNNQIHATNAPVQNFAVKWINIIKMIPTFFLSNMYLIENSVLDIVWSYECLASTCH